MCFPLAIRRVCVVVVLVMSYKCDLNHSNNVETPLVYFYKIMFHNVYLSIPVNYNARCEDILRHCAINGTIYTMTHYLDEKGIRP